MQKDLFRLDPFFITTITEMSRRKETIDIHNHNKETLIVLCNELSQSLKELLLNLYNHTFKLEINNS